MPAGLSINDFYYVLPEIVLTFGALMLLVVDLILPKRDGVVFGVAIATLLATAAVVLSFAGVNTTASAGLLAIDGFATFFKLIFILSAVMTVLMSWSYLRVEGVRAGEYCFLILCATLGMMFMASGVDLITLFIGLETMAISFYILVGFLKPSQRSNEAAVKYFLLGAFSLGLLLYGMSLLYGATGTTSLDGIATALAGGERSLILSLALILIGAGMGFKIAAVPFHMWAPDVYEGAPTPVTAFLSVGSKAASFAMLLRIFFVGLPFLVSDWQTLFWVLAALTMTVGNIAAITQTNTKRMLAYSSIAHAGYVLVGVVSGTERGIAATLVYLWVYLFMQLGAFAIISMLRRQDVVGDELKDLSGLYVRKPFAAIAMLIFMLSLGGIPPTAGFMGKVWVFGAAIDQGFIWLAVIGVVNSAISLYYYYRVIVFMWLKEETLGSDIEMSPAMATVLGIAVVGSILFGIFPDMLFDHAQIASEVLGSASSTVSLR
jgi:NADH-quinone oxidoreductase subunit N|tara:strand:+ start:518 stop:1987 length:1470 start_codon:yes stop_codon:yes gene_type:complete